MRRAIVIDDSRAMRSILTRVLEKRGFSVMAAENGVDALEQLARVRVPHLALVDWNMPQMNGIDFVEAIRADPSYDGMKVVMVTTETEPKQIERALRTGANEYMMKPFNTAVLIEKLSMVGLS